MMTQEILLNLSEEFSIEKFNYIELQIKKWASQESIILTKASQKTLAIMFFVKNNYSLTEINLVIEKYYHLEIRPETYHRHVKIIERKLNLDNFFEYVDKKQTKLKSEIYREEKIEREFKKEINIAFLKSFITSETVYYQKYREKIKKELFKDTKIHFVSNWINENVDDKIKLNNEQAIAIGSINNHVQVIARAGSGKTSTIVNRALFLQKHCGISPHEMLLLAFNRRAAEEIRTRLTKILGNELPHVMTFHALAYALVHPEENLLFDQSDGTQAKSQTLQSIIDDHLRDEYFYEKVRSLMLDRFYADWKKIARLGYGKSPEEMLEIRRSLVDEGLDGKTYKSFGEKTIANFLFEHDISYKYERNYEWDGINYRPDFTIFKSGKTGIIVEYFGLKGDPDYDEMSEQKRVFWESNPNWFLLELFPEDLKADVFAEKIKQKLEEFNIAYRKLSDEEIWERIKDRVIDRFTKAIVQFIQRCRKLSLTPEEVEDKIRNYHHDFLQRSDNFKKNLYSKYIHQIYQSEDELELENDISYGLNYLISECYEFSVYRSECKRIDSMKNAFLENYQSYYLVNSGLGRIINELCQEIKNVSIVKRFHQLAKTLYSAYLERLVATGEEDFDGLMQRATALVENGQTVFRRRSGAGNIESLKYVFIDEYQDFSELFYNLISAIRQQNSSALFFCVGDDWQSINGFAGSDLRFFTNFTEYFPGAQKLYLSTNYRSGTSIVEISNSLMKGLGQPGVAYKQEKGNIRYVNLNTFHLNEWEKELHSGDVITPAILRIVHEKLKNNQEVVLLSRKSYIHWYTNGNDELQKFIQSIYNYFRLSDEEKNSVTISTAHKYKGLEKTVVIILDAMERCYPLVHPDWIFMEVFGDTVQKIVQDERRLFYVALSRAVDELLIVTGSNNDNDSDKSSRFLEYLTPIPLIDWTKYPYVPPVDTSSKFLIEISNRQGMGSSPTIQIKDLLVAEQYRYDSRKRTWSKIIPSSELDLYRPFESSCWKSLADGIKVTVNDCYADRPIAIFNVSGGNFIRFNFDECIAKIDQELDRLGWSKAQGKEYLEEHYQKVSRHRLSDRQLDQFLAHLKSL